jgi:hypothetical protein
MRHRDSAEDPQPPRAALHVAIAKQRIGLMRRNLVRLLAMLVQQPVGISRQLQLIVVAVFTTRGRHTGRVHRLFPPHDASEALLPYRGCNSEGSPVACARPRNHSEKVCIVRTKAYRISVRNRTGAMVSGLGLTRQMLLWSPGTPSRGGAPLVLTGSTVC